MFKPDIQVCAILFASVALAALQNVTVDDYYPTGSSAPQYLPSSSDWHEGNDCSACLVKPNQSLAYDQTCHDQTYYPGQTDISILFNFTGTGLYIFFILANYVPNATTFTNVNFILDGVQASSFMHNSTSSTDFQYNYTVYANDSMQYGEHSMQIVPVNDGTDPVLILFDYLIYTTESPTAATAVDVGAIVGGTVGVVAALVVVFVSVICYRRHRRRTNPQPSLTDMVNVEPFILSNQTPVTSSGDSPSSNQQQPVELHPDQTGGQIKTGASALITRHPNPPTTASVTSAPSGSREIELLEQVEMLRDELAQLRRQHRDSVITSTPSVPPPEYSG